MDKDSAPTSRHLYPNLSDEELRAAEDGMDRYLELALRVFERTQADPPRYPQASPLTAGHGTVPCTNPRAERF